MNPAPILSSARLQLREYGPGDRDDLIALHREPRVREWLMDDFPLDRPEVAQQFLDRIAGFYRRHEGLGIWHASRVEGGRRDAIGWFSLMPDQTTAPASPDDPVTVAELGARLLPTAWGGSLSLEGGAALLAWGFERLGLARITAYCHPRQRSARLVLLALGFEPAGLQAYCGHPACAFATDAHGHAQARRRPLRERQRDALRRLRAEPADDTDAVPLHAPSPPLMEETTP